MSMDRSSKIGNDNEQQDNKNNVVIFSRINILQKKPKQSIAWNRLKPFKKCIVLDILSQK